MKGLLPREGPDLDKTANGATSVARMLLDYAVMYPTTRSPQVTFFSTCPVPKGGHFS